MLDELAGRSTIESVIADLEDLPKVSEPVSLAALYVLKNELDPSTSNGQEIEVDRSFILPASVTKGFVHQRSADGVGAALASWWKGRWAWFAGTDAQIFRDRCDHAFWRFIVPEVTACFGDLADVVLNTVNEAIINYAEYSFRRWSVRRRIHIRLFRTSGGLAYAIIRPSGGRLRSFDPLALKTRDTSEAKLKQRGWGHTLIMERALFLSFDHEPRRRGMLVIVGPEN